MNDKRIKKNDLKKCLIAIVCGAALFAALYGADRLAAHFDNKADQNTESAASLTDAAGETTEKAAEETTEKAAEQASASQTEAGAKKPADTEKTR